MSRRELAGDHPRRAAPFISLVIPAHNEERRLTATLERYYAAFTRAIGQSFELLVVCNGCSDATEEVAGRFQQDSPGTRVLVIHEAIGKGGAVLEGFRAAEGRRVLFADADGATSADSLLSLVYGLGTHDVVIGSRRTRGSYIRNPQPLTRRLFGAAFARSTRTLFKLGVLDTQCGAKALRKEAAVRLADVVSERYWSFDVDLLLRARDLRLTTLEQPVMWSDVAGSKLKVVPTMVQVLTSFYRMKMRYVRRGHDVLLPANLGVEAAASVVPARQGPEIELPRAGAI